MLAPETAIRARLAGIAELRGVYGLADAGGDVTGKPQPAAFVVFDGYGVRETVGRGKAARLALHWLVLVVARNVTQTSDGQAARNAIAPIVDAVLASLMGWSPGDGYTPLELTDAPAPQYDAGLLILPLAFVTERVVEGAS